MCASRHHPGYDSVFLRGHLFSADAHDEHEPWLFLHCEAAVRPRFAEPFLPVWNGTKQHPHKE